MVNHLCHIIIVVNYEISFIHAKLTITAERTLSMLVLAYAFKSVWDTKLKKRKELADKTEESKQSWLKYSLNKIKIHRMIKNDFDRETMNTCDCEISRKFALDLFGALKRGVLTEEQPAIENLFNDRKIELSHESLLLFANSIVSRELKRNPEEEVTDENHFVVQFICDRNAELRKLFIEQWNQVEEQLYIQVKARIEDKFREQMSPVRKVLRTLLDNLIESCNKAGSSEHKAFDSDSNFEIADMLTCDMDSEIKLKESPFKAMMLYLQMYLDPNISSEKFDEYFANEFEAGGVKMRISDTYKLCSKPINPKHMLDNSTFKKMDYTNMFSSDNIFNIFDYVEQFLLVLQNDLTILSQEDFKEVSLPIKQKFESDAIGCPNQCPSCGKLCEREIHPNDGRCQIKTGHQICSMGGKVWNLDTNTAVLFMCDDYRDQTKVVIQGRPSTWKQFKDLSVDQWDWTIPEDEKCVALQRNNRELTKNVWNKFGRGILKYYSIRGTDVSFVPYTASSEDLANALTIKYNICFVIDGTVSMATEIKKTRISVGQFISEYQKIAYTSEFRVVIYRDHCDKRVIEKFPNNSTFTAQYETVQHFLSSVKAVGGGDFPEAVLDGLATAAKESDWRIGANVRNIIIHIYDAPPHGDFPNYTKHDSRSNNKYCCCCNHGMKCLFDWDRDVWDNFKKFNIQYNGINTGEGNPEYEVTMKSALGRLCGDFQRVGEEVVNEAVLRVFIRTDKD